MSVNEKVLTLKADKVTFDRKSGYSYIRYLLLLPLKYCSNTEMILQELVMEPSTTGGF